MPLTSTDVDDLALTLAISARELLGLPAELQVQAHSASSSLASSSPTTPYTPPTLDAPPSPLAFLQRLHASHAPFLVRGCVSDRPACQRWRGNAYLRERMKGRNVRVACTPDGRADDIKCVDGREAGEGDGEGNVVFGLPAEVSMPFEELLDRLAAQERHTRTHAHATGKPTAHTTPPLRSVYYLQSQDSNLLAAPDAPSGDLSPLLEDMLPAGGARRSDLPWASEALGALPEAMNLWVGTACSVSSMHRDHYENLFSVLRGRKVFTVFPPAEGHFLCEGMQGRTYDVYRHEAEEPHGLRPEGEGEGEGVEGGAQDEKNRTPWIPIDPTQHADSPRNRPWKRYARGLKALRIEVPAGMTLFLPAGWYHHVAQETDGDGAPPGQGLCIAVNWWYESQAAFGPQWAMLDFIRDVGHGAAHEAAAD